MKLAIAAALLLGAPSLSWAQEPKYTRHEQVPSEVRLPDRVKPMALPVPSVSAEDAHAIDGIDWTVDRGEVEPVCTFSPPSPHEPSPWRANALASAARILHVHALAIFVRLYGNNGTNVPF